MTKVNNLPAYAYEYKEIVARYVCGEFWFWGAYATEEQSEQVAYEIGGVVISDFCD